MEAGRGGENKTQHYCRCILVGVTLPGQVVSIYICQTPFAGGLLHSRSVGLTAYASGKSFSPFPKRLKSCQKLFAGLVCFAVQNLCLSVTICGQPRPHFQAIPRATRVAGHKTLMTHTRDRGWRDKTGKESAWNWNP